MLAAPQYTHAQLNMDKKQVITNSAFTTTKYENVENIKTNTTNGNYTISVYKT